MEYKMKPTVTIQELNRELCERGFGTDELRYILFDSDYSNDGYKRLYIEDDPEFDDCFVEDTSEEEKEYYIHQFNIRKAATLILREYFPNESYVLIDVTW